MKELSAVEAEADRCDEVNLPEKRERKKNSKYISSSSESEEETVLPQPKKMCKQVIVFFANISFI